MSANTTIEWTDFTFNPWWGCTNVSPGCDHCYAEAWARRFAVKWGPGQTRRPASERTWSEPIAWNAKAQKDGVRRRVFCASMADVFDNEGLAAEREWLWELIEETPSLDWLLLTKRIGNVMGMVPVGWRERFPPHVKIGATMVDQEELDRDLTKLLQVPAARFISLEPLLGPVRLPVGHIMTGFPKHITRDGRAIGAPLSIEQVIVGGESGPGARSMVLGWAKEIVRDCQDMGVPVFVKQLGAKPVNREGEPHPISDRKGAIMDEWPEVLRVREFP